MKHTLDRSLTMSQVINNLPAEMEPLTVRVEETMRLGFTIAEGIKLVGIYDDGYRMIRQLIVFRDQHKNPDVRVQAKNWLKLIDAKGEIGSSYQAILRFVNETKVHRAKLFTWRKLNSQGHGAIDEALGRLRAREDVGEDVRRKIDELLASVVGKRMPGHLYAQAKALLNDHKVSKRVLAKKINSANTYAHAVVRACQMCDNLSDMTSELVLEDDRAMLVARLCAAASILLKVQSELLEGKGGRHDQARTGSDGSENLLHSD
jgi:hypothetical protein